MFKVSTIFVPVLVLLSCSGLYPPTVTTGHWSGNVREHPVSLQWTPSEPRIGDRVILKVTTDLVSLDPYPELGIMVARNPGAYHYLYLAKVEGDFIPEGWPEKLWTLGKEENFPAGWVEKTYGDLFTSPNYFRWIFGGIVLLGILLFLPFLFKKKSVVPASVGFLKPLENFKARLHSLDPQGLRELYVFLENVWQESEPPGNVLSQAWFFEPGMSWESLKLEFEHRRTRLFYTAEGLGWEEAEKDLDTLIFKERGKNV